MILPQLLQESLKQGKVIPFVGAGVSMSVLAQSGKPLFPSWKALLVAAAERLEAEKKPDDEALVRSLVNKGRFLDAAKEAQQGLGANWHDFLKSQFDKTSDQAQDASLMLAKLVWQLGSELVVTTNFDNVLHWACPKTLDIEKWNIEAAVEQCNLLRDSVRKPTIWHLHGHIGDSANIILTPDGYSRLYANDPSENRYKAAIQTLHHQLASRNFLFIGFSLADEDFTDQLRMLEELYQGAAGPHYVLLPESQSGSFKSPTSAIEPVFFRDFGEPLLECLTDMAAIVNAKTDPSITINTVVADYSPDKPVFYVPFRAKGEQMIGRREALEQVHHQLCDGKRTSIGQTAAFQGLGGLGKTQLAVEYAHAYRSEYPNGVIWINADQEITPQLIKLAEEAHWVSPLSEQPFKIQTALRRLRETSDCLIVFDNLEQLADIKEFLPKPQFNPHILVTSRIDQPGFNPVALNTLTPELGLQLLIQEAGREPDGEQEIQAANGIVERLDGLPLALELAGAYLRRRHAVSWREYLELLSDNPRLAFPAHLQGESLTHHEADIYATLKINESLFEEEPSLREVLDFLTWSGSAPMALSLLCASLGQDKPSALTGALSLGIALRILQRSDDGERYAIHRLVREVRREDVALETRGNWVESFGKRLSDWFEAHRQDFRDLPVFEAGLDHLEAWRQNAECVGFTLLVVRMIWLQAYPSYHWGRYVHAKCEIERALNLYEQSSNPDAALQAHLLDDLAIVTSEAGDTKAALKLEEKALAIRRKLYGECHSDTAHSLANIAFCFAKLRKYDKALELGEEALAIRFKLHGEGSFDTAISLNNVAGYYSDLGKHDKALELGRQALNIQLKLFGEEHPHTAVSLHNISIFLSSLKKRKEAFELGRRALLIRQKLLGDAHPDTILSQHNVICTLRNSGRKAEAVQLFQVQFPKLKPGDPHYHYFLELRSELFSGFRKTSQKSGKSKKRR
ncbi:tetratricopeptide repeat protein [Methylomonas sp. EFPC1]|uniref:tetratricopeptide repeat protein n=1 Tax=Methylomonas sp. EFPC1 TaxID=2812647 RepID=UPI0019685A11|nr:tetratricopeptide repeat protein [Methylomonas sp. EFPC1]QSB03251.1 tetratricopeptide repeat protein [Methylomonas sp. EFPC1]